MLGLVMEHQITYMTFTGPCIVIYSYNKANKMHSFSDLFDKVFYMFQRDASFVSCLLSASRQLTELA